MIVGNRLAKELEALCREDDERWQNPYKNRPGYEHIDPFHVLKKPWNEQTDKDKDVNFWMRTKEVQKHLEKIGQLDLQILRHRFEERMQEEADMISEAERAAKEREREQ